MRNIFNELEYEKKKELMAMSLTKIKEEYKKEIMDYNIIIGNILANNDGIIELYSIHHFRSALSDDYISIPIKGIDSNKHTKEKIINKYNKRIENYGVITKDFLIW